jgi:hypothetical protein
MIASIIRVVVEIALIAGAYVVGLNRNRAAAKAELEAAKAAILEKVEAVKK